MAGLILYSVNPRSLGEVSQWSLAVAEAARLHCNCIHLNPFHPVTAATKAKDGRAVSGSLYAATDHFTINPEFCGSLDQAGAWYHLRDFVRTAGAQKIRVMADLVLHHVAVDHPLVARQPNYFKHNADGSLFVGGPAADPWSDVAVIDYENPGAWEYFMGTDGYWMRMVDHYLDIGIAGFRCDMAARVPALVWEQVINHALRRRPDLVVLAETVGAASGDGEKLRDALRDTDAHVLYDLCYDDVGRTWDGQDSLKLNQARAGRLDDISRGGRMGFVDSHDFRPRAAELRDFYRDTRPSEADVKIAMTCLRDYAVACFTNNSVMLPRGFQYCIDSNVGVFREDVSPGFFRQLKARRKEAPSALTLGPAIAELHKLREQIPADVRVNVSTLDAADHVLVSTVQCDFHNLGDDRVLASIILLLNLRPELGPQKFPENWWREVKAKQSNAYRIHFGPDKAVPSGITGLAIMVVPGDGMVRMKYDWKNGPEENKPKAEELNLVA